MKQLVITPPVSPTISLKDFTHKFEFVGMIHTNGDKYILVPKDNNNVTFADVATNSHYSEFGSVSDCIAYMTDNYPQFRIFIFDDGIEMAKWILNKF